MGPVDPRRVSDGNHGRSKLIAALAGPQGSAGPQGPPGPTGGPGVLVFDADGKSLGRAHGFRPGTNYPNEMYVLLTAQPGGPGTPKVLLWREVDNALISFVSDCLNAWSITYFTELDCEGTLLVTPLVAPRGLVCLQATGREESPLVGACKSLVTLAKS